MGTMASISSTLTLGNINPIPLCISSAGLAESDVIQFLNFRKSLVSRPDLYFVSRRSDQGKPGPWLASRGEVTGSTAFLFLISKLDWVLSNMNIPAVLVNVRIKLIPAGL